MEIPSNDRIEQELMRQSACLYGPIGMGGVLGPVKDQYDRVRTLGYPLAQTLLKTFGLPTSSEAWKWLIMGFRLLPPTQSELVEAQCKLLEVTRSTPTTHEDDYPELPGYWTESVHTVELGNGYRRVTTRRVFHVR